MQGEKAMFILIKATHLDPDRGEVVCSVGPFTDTDLATRKMAELLGPSDVSLWNSLVPRMNASAEIFHGPITEPDYPSGVHAEAVFCGLMLGREGKESRAVIL